MSEFPIQRTYDLILMDPPWPYYRAPRGRQYRGRLPYPAMSLRELHQLPVGRLAASTGCILLMWTTGPMTPHVKPLMDSYGFRHITILFNWIKLTENGMPRCGMGHWTRSSAEYVHIGVRGENPLQFRQDRTVNQTFFTTKGLQHSAKPEILHDRLHQFFGWDSVDRLPMRRIELFARHTRPGWDSWGLEVTPDFFVRRSDETLSLHKACPTSPTGTIRREPGGRKRDVAIQGNLQCT